MTEKVCLLCGVKHNGNHSCSTGGIYTAANDEDMRKEILRLTALVERLKEMGVELVKVAFDCCEPQIKLNRLSEYPMLKYEHDPSCAVYKFRQLMAEIGKKG